MKSRLAARRLVGSGPLRLNEGTRCPGGNSAIHEQRLFRDIAARFGSEEHNCGVKIFRLVWAFYGDAVGLVVDPFFAFVEDLVLFGAGTIRGRGNFTVMPCLPQSSARRPLGQVEVPLGLAAHCRRMPRGNMVRSVCRRTKRM